MSLSRLKKVAREYNRHPKGSPGGVGGRFAPKDKVSSPVKGDGVSRLKTIATKAAKQPIKQPGQPAIEKDLAKIKAFKKIGSGVEGDAHVDYENGVVYKVIRGFNKARDVDDPNEVTMLRKANKLGIGPKLYNYDPNTGVIATQFINGDSAQMDKDPVKTKKGKLRAMIGIIEQMKVLHENKIVHGDLHSGNVIANSKGDVSILDFGMAQELTRFVENDGSRYREIRHIISDFMDEEHYYKGLSDSQVNQLEGLKKKQFQEWLKISNVTQKDAAHGVMREQFLASSLDEILQVLKSK